MLESLLQTNLWGNEQKKSFCSPKEFNGRALDEEELPAVKSQATTEKKDEKSKQSRQTMQIKEQRTKDKEKE